MYKHPGQMRTAEGMFDAAQRRRGQSHSKQVGPTVPSASRRCKQSRRLVVSISVAASPHRPIPLSHFVSFRG